MKIIAVVGVHYDPVQPDRTGGSGIACYRIARSLAFQQGVQVSLVCPADSQPENLAQLGVRILRTEVRSKQGVDPSMTEEECVALGRVFYSQAEALLQGLQPDQVVFNLAREETTHIRTRGRINMIHVPWAVSATVDAYTVVQQLGTVNIAVSGSQYRADSSRYHGYIDNSLPFASWELPRIGQKQWPPQRSVFTARIVPEKGTDLALSACQELRNSGFAPNLRLHICGGADGRSFADQLLARLPPWAEYHGNVGVGVLRSVLSQADLGFFLSNPRNGWIESFGYTGVEMLAAGVPIVAFAGTGFVPDYGTPRTVATIPWQPEYEPVGGGTTFGTDCLEVLRGFQPDWHACQQVVTPLAMDYYGARFLALLQRHG